MVAFAHAHSPFYRDLWAGHSLEDWRRLPTVDKASMMAHFDRFNTRGVTRATAMAVALQAEHTRDFAPTVDGLTVGLSSGTSGHRGLFLVSPAEQAAWAGVILARALHRVRAGRTRVAFFLRSHSNLYAEANGALIQLRYFDLMMHLEEAIAALNAYRPHIVVGPPSLLGFLADALADGSLQITPERLISVAEVLEPQDARRLQDAFQAPVHQVYQCTEGLLAVSCVRGSLHIQEDIVALQFEPLDEETSSNQPLAPSLACPSARVTPIVTDLWRRTQPIIRYRLNDVVRLAPQPCPCGCTFRVIESIEGRCDDVCYFLTPTGERRPFFADTIRRIILLSSPLIADYQAFQESDGQLRIHLAVEQGAPFDQVAQSVRSRAQRTIAGYGCTSPDLEIESGLIPTAPGAKRRRIQRNRK